MGACNQTTSVITNDKPQGLSRTHSGTSDFCPSSDRWRSPILQMRTGEAPQKVLNFSVDRLNCYIEDSQYKNSPEREDFYLFTPCQQTLSKKNSLNKSEKYADFQKSIIGEGGCLSEISFALESPQEIFMYRA